MKVTVSRTLKPLFAACILLLLCCGNAMAQEIPESHELQVLPIAHAIPAF